MKKAKILLIMVLGIITFGGCFKRDNMDNIDIMVSKYPIEYLVTNIYGFNSNIDSIYPLGTNVDEYNLTKKQIKSYSKKDMFIYNGLTEEKKIAADFLNNNSEMKIIDVSKGITLKYSEEELWLSPSNYLMLAQNIKDALIGYTNSSILKQEITEKYDELKLNISYFDANLKVIAENASNKTIIVGNNLFKFLEKYGFNVLSIEENEKKKSDFQDAKNAITSKSNSYVFVLENNESDENVQRLKSAGAKIIKIKSLKNLTSEEKNSGYDYQQYINTFIDDLKNEVYN